jgi:hypothetical protein
MVTVIEPAITGLYIIFELFLQHVVAALSQAGIGWRYRCNVM